MGKYVGEGWWSRICNQAEKERERKIKERFRDIDLRKFIKLLQEEITKNFHRTDKESYTIIVSTKEPYNYWFDRLELHRVSDNYSECYFLKVRHYAKHSDDYSDFIPRLYWTSEIRATIKLDIFKPNYNSLSSFFEEIPLALTETIIERLS